MKNAASANVVVRYNDGISYTSSPEKRRKKSFVSLSPSPLLRRKISASIFRQTTTDEALPFYSLHRLYFQHQLCRRPVAERRAGFSSSCRSMRAFCRRAGFRPRRTAPERAGCQPASHLWQSGGAAQNAAGKIQE